MSTQIEQDKDGTEFGPWWWAAAVVVLLVVAGLVWVLLKGGSHPAPRAATPTAPGPTTATTPAAPSPASPSSPPSSVTSVTSVTSAATAGWPDTGCNGTPGSADPPQVAMRDVTWTPFLAISAPISPTLGPKRVAGPLRQCYQHSPSGALIAAVNIMLAAGAQPSTYKRVVDAQFTAGPGRDAALASFDGSQGDTASAAAFRIGGCTPSVCNVELILFGDGRYLDQSLPLTWAKGDWYVNGAVTVPQAGLVQAIPAGFTAWGPSQ